MKLDSRQPLDVGSVPPDWEVRRVGDIARFSSGSGINVSRLHDFSTDYPVPVFGGNGIAGYTSTAMVAEATVVIGRVGQRCGEVYLTRGPAWVSDNALYPVEVLRACDLSFFALALKAAGLNRSKNRNDLPLITQSILHAVTLPLPRAAVEQREIAAALGDVDNLLDGLDRLIVKKRDLKQATMQQLLSGQTRLPGFAADWRLIKLGELCSFVDGTATSGGDLDYLEIGDVDVETKTYDLRGKDKPSVRGAVLVPAGTLLISTVRPTRGAIALTRSALHVSSAFCRVQPVNGLAFHLVCQTKFLSYLGENSIGGTYPVCSDETILDFESTLPTDPSEQAAMATILSDMDDEIAALRARRDKTEALKQAMMQELLTGRTRLVKPETADA